MPFFVHAFIEQAARRVATLSCEHGDVALPVIEGYITHSKLMKICKSHSGLCGCQHAWAIAVVARHVTECWEFTESVKYGNRVRWLCVSQVLQGFHREVHIVVSVRIDQCTLNAAFVTSILPPGSIRVAIQECYRHYFARWWCVRSIVLCA